MVHTLQVMRDNYRVLLATMSVFINEPSLDWLKNAQKQCKENVSYDEENWYPREKVAVALNKLKGSHPRTATTQDLRSGHARRPHFNSLLKLLHDDTDTPWMRDMPEQGLTARQQYKVVSIVRIYRLSQKSLCNDNTQLVDITDLPYVPVWPGQSRFCKLVPVSRPVACLSRGSRLHNTRSVQRGPEINRPITETRDFCREITEKRELIPIEEGSKKPAAISPYSVASFT
ncbi:hypothetical protein J6590_071020 [Homalodisca vitripennis]|nr:hypothetical protein J6590_071020 [Homalodisca vitripennis]